MSDVGHYRAFRDVLNLPANVYVVQLCATKATRCVRRIERPKSSSEEWRDMVDRVDPEDTSFASTDGDFTFLRIANDGLAVGETIRQVRRWAPELFTER